MVTDRRYERLVRDQVPDAALVLEPIGRNTAAAIALATLVIDRADDEVMVVLPADQTIERRCRSSASPRRGRRATSRTGAFGIEEPLVTLGIQVDRPATEYGYLIPDVARGARHLRAAAPIRSSRFEEKPKPARAEELAKDEGVAWNAGIFLWRRGAIGQALTRYTGLLQSLGPMVGTPTSLPAGLRGDPTPVSIDYAVMEGAAQSGQVVMASMDVGWSDLGSWTALLAALGARGDRRGRAGRGVGRGRTTTTSSSGAPAVGSGSSRHPSAVG